MNALKSYLGTHLRYLISRMLRKQAFLRNLALKNSFCVELNILLSMMVGILLKFLI